ncbi:hypothetical protein H4R24_004452 [Coemansia sp. RSA 988]|nr:hypothetical protein H4R24_004452 [Coemansia sp. RSA 988]
MPLVTFSNDSSATSAGPSQTSTTASDSAPQPSSQWHSQRAARVQRLETALDAVMRRRHAEDGNGRRRPQHEPDYGSMLDSESEDNDNRSSSSGRGSSSSSNSLRSDNSSLFYSEGQPLLCTYQPRQYPMPVAPTTSTEASVCGGSANTAGGAAPLVLPKTPEQYLPWSRRARDALNGFCASLCCPGSAQ